MSDALAIRPTSEPTPDDHFEAQAQAMFKTWAAKNRQLQKTLDELDGVRHDLNAANARIDELVRANQQLHERVGESMSREAVAHGEAARLTGIMQISGLALADGMAREPTIPRSRPRPVS